MDSARVELYFRQWITFGSGSLGHSPSTWLHPLVSDSCRVCSTSRCSDTDPHGRTIDAIPSNGLACASPPDFEDFRMSRNFGHSLARGLVSAVASFAARMWATRHRFASVLAQAFTFGVCIIVVQAIFQPTSRRESGRHSPARRGVHNASGGVAEFVYDLQFSRVSLGYDDGVPGGTSK